MAYDRLTKRLAAGEIIVLDGATGTELQRRGAAMDPAAWCAPATLHADRLLTEIHADYIDAGADVITANTFASSRLMLSGAGLAERTDEINRRAVATARPAGALGRYFRTVRGETRNPSFSHSSFAIRSCPHTGFSFAIR
jgi:methionine synthase I (cobalamin-dependent)